MASLHESLREAQTLGDVKQLISSVLEIQNKMVSCASANVSPQLNDDYPLGNFSRDDESSLRRNFILARTALDMGADEAYMNYIHENNEITNITRGRQGFQNRIMRSNISQSSASIREESASGFKMFGRQREQNGAY
jgi:hypothetical protein